MAWQVYELSDAPTALSIVGIAMSTPHVLLLLVGGAVSDRFDRRTVMITADLVRGAAVAVLGILSLGGVIEVWHIAVLAAFYGAGTAFFGPSFDAIVPDLVPSTLLTQANSLDQFVRPTAWQLAGPAIGGVVIGVWGAGGAFLLDAGTFAVSIVALAAMRPRPRSEVADVAVSLLRDVGEGFRYIRSRVWLWGTFLAAACAYLLFLGPIEVLLPLVVKNEMGRSAADLGFILGSVESVLSVLRFSSAAVASQTEHDVHLPLLDGVDLCRGGLWVRPSSLASNDRSIRFWFAGKRRSHSLGDHEAAPVPGRLLGRVSSLDWFISIGLVPVSYALTGPVAGLLGARTTFDRGGTSWWNCDFLLPLSPGNA